MKRRFQPHAPPFTAEEVIYWRDSVRLDAMKQKREQMIMKLYLERKFTPEGATKAVDNFLETLEFVLEDTGALPISTSERP